MIPDVPCEFQGEPAGSSGLLDAVGVAVPARVDECLCTGFLPRAVSAIASDAPDEKESAPTSRRTQPHSG